MHSTTLPEDIKVQYKYAIEQARKDPSRFINWIKNEIETAIALINKFDKIYVLGGLGSRLIKSTPTFYNQFLATYNGPDKEEINEEELLQDDEQIEVLLEYAMSMATATPNTNKNIIPTQTDIEAIYQQLSKIKSNINFLEISADVPAGGNEFDSWLRTNIMIDTMNVRGDGYHAHIEEIYKEVFAPHNGFFKQYYGFDAEDVYNTVLKLDLLVYSKVGNPFGGVQSHKRLTEWMEKTGEGTISKVMQETGKHFIRQFTEANPDLYDAEAPEKVIMHSLGRVESYNKIFWVIPQTEKEKLIFEKLSLSFDSNQVFFQPPKFKGFPLNDTLIKLKPLIKEDGKYYHFSLNLAFRNIFKITEELIKNADAVYYEHSFKGNSHADSRDNYIELKTKQLFQKLLPNATVYHSLKYDIVEDGLAKKPELDILAISGDTIYIIEVKAGQLNQRHRRGEMLSLKDRLKDTINEGSYQCHRALKYIQESPNPTYEYIEGGAREY